MFVAPVFAMGLTFYWRKPWDSPNTTKSANPPVNFASQEEPELARARDTKGRFLGDDISTPERDEAWTEKPKRTSRKKRSAS